MDTFEALKPEYTQLLGSMIITRQADVDDIARRLLKNKSKYQTVSKVTGIPIVWIAASFEREASSDFSLSPAQGDPWNKPSVHVPKGRGPFMSWQAAAIDAYHLNGLAAIGAGNWTWELACYYGELFNGFGYRDYHREHTPYLWAGTNIQQRGKYTSDGRFDRVHYDEQLGMVPIMIRMAQLDSSLAFAPVPAQDAKPIPPVQAAPSALRDAKALQAALNALGANPPLEVDGSYGLHTYLAVKQFQSMHGLASDGIAGPATWAEITQLQE